MKTSDVVFSLQAALITVVNTISSSLDPNGFKIEDDYTVIIKIIGLFLPIFSGLSHSANSIVSEKTFKKMGKKSIKGTFLELARLNLMSGFLVTELLLRVLINTTTKKKQNLMR
jgi:hypothetical protein